MSQSDRQIITQHIGRFVDELSAHLESIIMALPDEQLSNIIIGHLGSRSPHESFINVIVAYNSRFIKE